MKALVIVDAQYDFMPAVNAVKPGVPPIGGALAVPNGQEVVPEIEKLMCDPGYQVIVATQDWHPTDHCSFVDKGGPWPRHCVQGTDGAKIHEKILRPSIIVVQKGVSQDVDSYSGFWDNERKHETELNACLQRAKVAEVHITGLALDYCVMFTALDAVAAGYKTVLLTKACRGVEINLGDCAKAIEGMRSKGVIIQ